MYPVPLPHKKCPRVEFGGGPAGSSPAETGSGGLLACKYGRRERFFPSRRRPAGLQLARRPLGRPCFLPVLSHLHSSDPTPVHPVPPPLPEPGVEPTSRGGWGRSRREHRVQGGSRGGSGGVPVCDGSAAGGKTARSGGKRPGTTVPRHETGRRGLGAVPINERPVLSWCLSINGRW